MKYHNYAWILATSALSLVHQNSGAGVVLAEKVDGVQDPAEGLAEKSSSNNHDQGMLLRRSYLSYDHDTDTQNEIDSGSNLRMLKSKASKKNKVGDVLLDGTKSWDH
jgi:hypothetical protein